MTKTKTASSLRMQDPFLVREKERYTDPLPSREWVIEVMESLGVPVSVAKLAKLLSIARKERGFFDRRIGAMVRDGQVHINRKGDLCVAEKLALIKCRVEGHKDGFGFAIPLEKTAEGDLVLNERQMRTVMHGDIVSIRPAGTDRRGRREGQVVEILEHSNPEVVARLYKEHGVYIAVPEDKRINQNILIEANGEGEAQDGQVITVKISSYPEKNRQAIGRVSEVIGNYADSGMEIEIAVRKHHLPYIFSDECLKAAKKIPQTVTKADLKDRVDLRELNLVTIDGETARDFDDAIYAEKQGNNYRLVVAIADVSHYVTAENALDVDAITRGTSVYFPRRVIPMLPEALSNGICSLNPAVDRLCMVCDMIVEPTGNIKSYKFYPAVMRSKARLTYNQVWEWIDSGVDHSLKKEIDTLYSLFQILLKKRHQRGAIEFETVETQMIFNDSGKIERIEPIVRNEAHKVIEECMLAANVCTANFLIEHKHPALFRSHLGPTEERLTNLRAQLALTGLTLNGGDKPTPKDYAELFVQFKERPDAEILQVMLLRSMQQAVYEPENQGHFGLAYEAYTHFTSPIRRYPDLLVHRAIKAVLQKTTYTPKSWQSLGVHCSFTERRADDASRDVENWLKTFYMQDKVGEEFEGRISGMAHFGLFIMLDNIHVEGMIHISDLGQDYFNYRPEIMAIEGERTKVRYTLGDKVSVKVAAANLDTSKIDLILIKGGSQNMASTDTDKRAPKAKTRSRSPKAEAKKHNKKQSAQAAPKAKPAKAKAKPSKPRA